MKDIEILHDTKGCPFGKQCFVAKYILTGGKENFEIFKTKLLFYFKPTAIKSQQNLKYNPAKIIAKTISLAIKNTNKALYYYFVVFANRYSATMRVADATYSTHGRLR